MDDLLESTYRSGLQATLSCFGKEMVVSIKEKARQDWFMCRLWRRTQVNI